MAQHVCACACLHSDGFRVKRDISEKWCWHPIRGRNFLVLHLIHSSLYLSLTYSVLPLLSIFCMSINLVLKQGYFKVLCLTWLSAVKSSQHREKHEGHKLLLLTSYICVEKGLCIPAVHILYISKSHISVFTVNYSPTLSESQIGGKCVIAFRLEDEKKLNKL